MSDPLDFEARANARLPEHVRHYFATGSGSQATARESSGAWSSIRFRPRVLTGCGLPTTSVSVLGTLLETPILIAPMAQQRAAHLEAEVAMARAAAAAGSMIGVSTHTAVPFREIAATGCPWWFQVYLMRDRYLTELLVRRAAAAGARALMLTADLSFTLPTGADPRLWPAGPDKTRHANLSDQEVAAAGSLGLQTDPGVDLTAIDWLHSISGLPVVVKGILRADDATRCVDAGASGLVVSSHGGRRMGASISSAAALSEVVAAVADRAEIYVDSGIRSGEHVVAALALGARAVFLGRPVMWALAAEGGSGVRELLIGRTTELVRVMTQLGVPKLSGLTSDLIG